MRVAEIEFESGSEMKRVVTIIFVLFATAGYCQSAFGKGSSGSSHSSSTHSSTFHGRSSSGDSAYYGYRSSGSHSDATKYSDGVSGVQRDSHGRIKRSEEATDQFKRETGYPKGRPGYVIDHIIPLKRGGPDTPSNMQWQTIEDAKRKDKTE
jgi:hypothetical protein